MPSPSPEYMKAYRERKKQEKDAALAVERESFERARAAKEATPPPEPPSAAAALIAKAAKVRAAKEELPRSNYLTGDFAEAIQKMSQHQRDVVLGKLPKTSSRG